MQIMSFFIRFELYISSSCKFALMNMQIGGFHLIYITVKVTLRTYNLCSNEHDRRTYNIMFYLGFVSVTGRFL